MAFCYKGEEVLKIKLFAVLLLFLFAGCQESKTDNGVAEMHWDRDMCARCVMVMSDRNNAVQLRDIKSNKVYKFDDIGCLALWLKEENIEFKDSAKIWITDLKTGEWIDARTAFYTAGNITPMSFGYSAYKSKESIKDGVAVLTYSEVMRSIK